MSDTSRNQAVLCGLAANPAAPLPQAVRAVLAEDPDPEVRPSWWN